MLWELPIDAEDLSERPNRVLKALGPAERALIAPHLEVAPLVVRHKVYARNRRFQHVYFPESGIISFVAAGSRGRQAEVGMVGCEGVTGASCLFDADHATWDALVQVAGSALRMRLEDVRRAAAQSGELTSRLLQALHIFNVQCGATAFANAHGTIEERLARWLLMAHDRMGSAQLPLTHEYIAVMLGVRRPGVALALHGLERRALVRISRGSICVLDREGLIEQAHGFYGAPEAELSRFFA